MRVDKLAIIHTACYACLFLFPSFGLMGSAVCLVVDGSGQRFPLREGQELPAEVTGNRMAVWLGELAAALGAPEAR